ncbi:Autophagy-related protein 2 [Madurella mycetomatis]|uniref:Autophagy-related protein 2 n=1 Tax=Madurella mycetomatis TaxID=100816 RepID=A0A175WEA2_9PEZI|nr:Autophagy-related protein 2 [Madurella mycetomatis]KXX83116.1 Autophagy-related protein 2 [Madurella mycetomatis]
MASFFQSFRSSLMPKQLLRFALSRLDILDARALDLENLDFALGRNTVLEFRDVGLVLQKLETLLELPPAFSLQKAKVLVLRVTIPMDFYTSPITAEVDGVNICLKVVSKQEKDEQHSGKRRKGIDAADVVPTAADLAQSFLETQPVEEKKELEEALVAETQDLGASVAISEAESDDGSTFGTGQALSLPAFLTDFLQGIVDRTQVHVRGVTFQVDVEVPVDAAPAAPELVTFQLSMDNINVEGVTTPGQASDGGPTIVPKDGKRHVLLDNIRAFLISEANVFSSLAPSPSMPSSVASRSPVTTETPPFPEVSGRLERSVSSGSAANSDDLAQSRYPLQDSEDAFNIPYELEENSDQKETEEAAEPTSPLSTPRASVYRESVHQDLIQGSLHQNQSFHQGSDHDSVHQDPPPLALREPAKSTIVEPGPATWSTFEREAQSEPFLRPPDGFPLSNTRSPQASIHSVSTNSSSDGTGAEDLTQSHLYSHEEAASMYMSAFSQAESGKLRGAMPGSWDDADEFADAQSSSREDVTTPSTVTPSAPGLQKQGDSGVEGKSSNTLGESSLQLPPTYRPRSPDGTIQGDSDGDGASSHAQLPLSQDEPEPQQDDIPTPRGPTRLVKEILSLSSISIYLPSTHNHIQVSAPDLGKSVPQNLPGAFSVHSAATRSPNLGPVGEPHTEGAPVDRSIEIILKPVDVRFDASIGFLLANVVSRLIEAAQRQSGEAADPAASKPSSTTPEIKLTVEQLSVHFLEKLAGVADTPERLFQTRMADFNSDILLQANVTDLRGSVSKMGSQTEANISIEKFKFGYANEDIISFDRSVQLFESVASTFPTTGQDISIKATSGPEISRVEINTLPLHVKLDLQRLDETFSWFGGLSSFLGMGSSVTSNTSRGGKVAIQPAQKSKGVRFEAPMDTDDRIAAKENKTDLRINGILLDIVGRDCSVALNTSALKLVNREKGIGIHLSRIRLSGPHIRNSRADIPIIAEVVDTRLDYAMLPRHQDLERLLELITPSKIKFDMDEDEIMVDTLLRQRKKGPVLSLTIGKAMIDAGSLQQLSCLPGLADDLSKLGTVAKYLPEDDRPGLLTLCHVKNFESNIEFGGRFGAIQASLTDLEVAHITVPALVAVAVGTAAITRNKIEDLVGTVSLPTTTSSHKQPPAVMMRLIDDIEPVVKVNLNGLRVEYRVPTIMDVLDLAEDATPQDFEASLAASVANLGDQAHTAIKRTPSEPSTVQQAGAARAIKVDVAFRDCLVGLNPLGMPSKLTLVLTDAHLEVIPGKRDAIRVQATLKKASVLLVDDVLILESTGAPFASTRRPQVAPSPQVTELCRKGYVNICQISSARARVHVTKDAEGETQLELELRDDLLVLETCADSTQTLIALANALKPPTPPSKEIKYRTSVVPVQDLLASISAEAFGQAEGDYDYDNDFAIADELAGRVPDDAGSEDDYYGGSNDSPLDLDSQYYEGGAVQEELFDATNPSLVAGGTAIEDTNDGVLLSTASIGAESSSDSLSIQDSYFQPKSTGSGTAHRWNSKKNTYDNSNDANIHRSPLKVSVRDVHIIWHLFDGYDWARTREVIAKAVQDVEAKAYERRARADRRGGYDQDSEEDETVIGDFLFNSIYIGIPANRDPKELTQAINQDLQDMETASVATTAVTATTVRAPGQHRRSKSLKLSRSKRHKITFELKGVNADLVVFPPGSGETVSSIDLKVRDLDVFDHVPESTWKKFAMYDFDAGERELGANMIHLEIINTKPVLSTPASEIVLTVTVLPLRLHVDQDALDFITRFFEFKDDSVPIHASPSDIPFIQRVEVKDVPVKLDFKPKRVDYAGLRSGHTTEFMNFMILEDARMVLRRVILYGVSGFDRLGKQLNDVWMDDVKRNQLPGILAGLAPVRSLVNAGSGFRDLIEIPIREYRKDGRVVRSVRKGATAFAKTTGTEVVKLGAKLAIGTQNALQGAEGLFVPIQPGESSSTGVDDWEETEYGEESHRKISPYADQPLGIMQGVRGAYASLAKDLSLARDAIIAVPAEVMESQSAQGAAKVVLKKAPTIIFRPAIGATKAIGQTLLGATNSLDPQNRRRAEAKYKKY